MGIPAPMGKATVKFGVPGGLVGRTLHVQGLVLHAAAPSTWRFTNVGMDVLGHRLSVGFEAED